MNAPVFFDPTGRRPRWWRRLIRGLGLAGVGAVTLYGATVVIAPAIAAGPTIEAPAPVSLADGPADRPADRPDPPEAPKVPRGDRTPETPTHRAPSAPVVAAFYAPWNETGLYSLRAHAGKLTHLMPEWLHLSSTGDGLDLSEWDPEAWPLNLEVVRIAREHAVAIHPMLSNAASVGEGFDPAGVHRLLASPARQQRTARAIRDWLVARGFQGLNLDLESLYPGDYRRLPAFIRRLRDELHAAGLTLSIDVEAEEVALPRRDVAGLVDFVVLMAYDLHDAGGEPGPIAPFPWYRRILKEWLRDVPREKLVVGIGNYAYDWPRGKPPATTLTYQLALLRARLRQPGKRPAELIRFDSASRNPAFAYRDSLGCGHEVWMLDGVTAYNQWVVASRELTGGAALWLLGQEDPSLWSFYDRRSSAAVAESLATVRYPPAVEYDGEGEVLAVESRAAVGFRLLRVDRTTGTIARARYLALPSSIVVRRTGYRPGKIVLSFDDGPDPEFTPQILDVLREARVPAVFFMVGTSAARNPGLVRRVWEEGHEIGLHTLTHPNLGEISPVRALLEFNAPQRILQNILGRSSRLFRPPYRADAEPRTPDEIRPVLMASERGYLTIGELLDPEDWRLWQRADVRRSRAAGDMQADLLRALGTAGKSTVTGNVVLLHDGGGDRRETVALIKSVIPLLRAEGYEFTSLSGLLGVPRDSLLPVAHGQDRLLSGIHGALVDTALGFRGVLRAGFLLAVVLGIARVVFLTGLALAVSQGWRRARRATGRAGHAAARRAEAPPRVSVLIACYSERPVIAATIRSVLASRNVEVEVIVVDDGSADGTAQEVRRCFGDDPRVRLLRQANSGKAVALNRALAEARYEAIACLDADTCVAPGALARLALRFDDPRVGAAAGEVRVGNPVNLLTRWQALEYVVSQNLDRLAMALGNAVTVVPGAIGAWRRSAVLAVGGYRNDTVAEDMDLTWCLRRAGWRIVTENRARGFTEAPDTLRAFVGQRVRWTYGTLQCLWKHRGALGRYGWFGWVVLPSVWLFQILFQVVAPLVDLQIAWTLGSFLHDWMTTWDLRATAILHGSLGAAVETGVLFALFTALELIGGALACRLGRERMRLLWWLPLQRFLYRQILYAVVCRCLAGALAGIRLGWSKLPRKGTVALDPEWTPGLAESSQLPV
ncbi:MAG TPA: glycosyltransferase [Gemmatimonadales bacterium]|nr:glycosyltransferase [Gemmatimonadales bacterium]